MSEQQALVIREQAHQIVMLEQQIAALREAATGLVNSVSPYALEEAREAWGNTNVAVVEHWKAKVIAALAPRQQQEA